LNFIYTIFTNPKKPKFFIKIIILVLIGFISFHLIIWELFTKQILNTKEKYYVGDLARLSYQKDSIFIRKLHDNTLNKKHIELNISKNQIADIITIGDSFSNGVTHGKNPYYQDYITNELNISVLNIAPYPFNQNYIERINSLLNNGFLKKAKTKIIIIESIQRQCINRFAVDINWNYSLSQKDFFKYYKENTPTLKNKEDGIIFINDGNYKFIRNLYFYSKSDSPSNISTVYQATLNQNMFSVKASNSLLFYSEDIINYYLSNSKAFEKINKNLNKLAKKLKKQKISLIFMPAVDKYTLYYPYIKNNNLPNNNFFETMDSLKKDYYFVNTKKMLSTLLPKTKDLYYADDTHWSYKASKHIIKNIPLKNILQTNEL